MICDRCGNESLATIMSIFNTEMICPACREKEQLHPAYARAKAAERQAVRAGNFNFLGVGKPKDL